jgi:hypothetical protein
VERERWKDDGSPPILLCLTLYGRSADRGERGLAHLKRVAAKVVAVQLDQVEGVREDMRRAAVLPPGATTSAVI